MKSLMIIAIIGISTFSNNYHLLAIRPAYASAAASNLINKLSALGKGKQLIKSGIATDTNNVESRLIRHGVQRNLPGVLNYRDQLKNDSAMMVQKLDMLRDQDLKKRIINFMKRG